MIALLGDRDGAEQAAERLAAAGLSALALTIAAG